MKEYAKCLYYENACFDNPIVTVRDGQDRKHLTLEEVVDLLNEQQATINELQAQLREKEREERLYANEILELRETNKEHIKFKSLGGDY